LEDIGVEAASEIRKVQKLANRQGHERDFMMTGQAFLSPALPKAFRAFQLPDHI